MTKQTARMKCPFCAEEIKVTAKKCKHCGEFMHGESRQSILDGLRTVTQVVFRTGDTTGTRTERNHLLQRILSGDNEAALDAVERLRDKGWLEDGSLDTVNLQGANLEAADLRGAKLKGADLRRARLRGANMDGAWMGGVSGWGSNLQDADLRSASLRQALLSGANLQDADLRDAHLEGSFLFNTNLDGADLRGANLTGARLQGARMEGANLEGAVMPERLPTQDEAPRPGDGLAFVIVPSDPERRTSESWRVLLIPGSDERQVLALDLRGEAELGRGLGVDVGLMAYTGMEYGISRNHVRLNTTQHTLTITDLGSTNGTHLNGHRLEPDQPTELSEGDTLQIGRATFIVKIVHRPGAVQ